MIQLEVVMDFRDLLRTLTRHWAIALVVGSLVLMLGMAAAFLPEKTYSATATLVLDLADEHRRRPVDPADQLPASGAAGMGPERQPA